MYVFLTRPFKNVGDFLIAEKGKQLLKHHKPEHELKEFHSAESLNDKIDILNESELIIINGGPGYQPQMYPKIYPLVDDLSELDTPIAILGMGWRSFPGDEISVNDFSFTKRSKKLLKLVNKNNYLSCRDYITQRLVKKNGFSPVTMTGCPAWYDSDNLERDLHVPNDIEKIVFTTPARKFYLTQSANVMKVLNDLFPNTKKYCTFHKGIRADKHLKIKERAEQMNYTVKDTSCDISKIEFYKDCDLHVGYRVHGHLYFLAHRLPSLLIEEDGRGRGANESLGLPRLPAWNRRVKISSNIKPFKKIINNLLFIYTNKFIPEMVKNLLIEEVDNDFRRIQQSVKIIDSTYEDMKKFIESFP